MTFYQKALHFFAKQKKSQSKKSGALSEKNEVERSKKKGEQKKASEARWFFCEAKKKGQTPKNNNLRRPLSSKIPLKFFTNGVFFENYN